MMSERTPKQPLNDPEYTVPEYSVLLPSDEAENSTVESSAAEDNAPGDSAPEHASTPEQATTGYREATADYTATVSAEQVIPKRPQAMRSVIWCATAMIALGTLSNFLSVMLPWQSYIDFEMVVRTLFSMLAFTLFASIIPIFILWKVWDGREWARILAIIYCALAAASGVLILADNFSELSSRAAAASSLVRIASGVLTLVLYLLMIVLLTRAPIRTYTQIVSGARALEHQQMMSETRQAAGQVPAELREIFADDEDDERTSSGGNTPRPPHRSAGWGT
ncbi:multidrug ABC transporter permease [Rothia sp. HMSC071C12]|jgi:multidrug ABC transporter, permease protein|uniref:multidrug ABC transporter permease n=2 Tax=unclassified Rothia (in: high G+C Gram-positive bacteria) TaxID=2689056 RepID=UPI001FEF3F09|nr:multidrug ABC transporter permease [Rothia sp. HMSC071C12]